jgi:hypothetical protein
MSLLAWIGLDGDTGATASTPKPINNGVPVMATDQPNASTGFFGWLDDLGSTVGDVAGRAVDVVSDNFLNDLSDTNDNPAKTPDVTPVPSDSKLPVNQSFFEANKTYLMYGGIAIVGVAALALAFRK